MEILANIVNLNTSSGVLLALLPLILIMAIIYCYEKRVDVPKLQSLNPAQKFWLFMRSLNPSLAAKVVEALGAEVSWRYIKESNNLAPQAERLTAKINQEFCAQAAELFELRQGKENYSTEEFLEINYHNDGALLAQHLCKVWPLEIPQEQEKTEKAEAEAEVPESNSNN